MLGFYSLIQYQPNALREEGANVGVLLYTTDAGTWVKFSRNLEAVKRYFGAPLDTRRFELALEAMRARIEEESTAWKGVNDLKSFTLKEVNSLVLRPPRSTRFDDPQVELQRLYESRISL